MGVIPARYLQGFGLPASHGELEIDSPGVAFYKRKKPLPILQFKWCAVGSINIDDPGRTKANVAAIVGFGVLGMASRKAFSIITLTTETKGIGYFETEWPVGTWRGIVPHILSEVPEAAGKLLIEGRDVSQAQTNTAADESDPIAQIAKLGGLRDKGLLTDEEFAAKKQELLKRI